MSIRNLDHLFAPSSIALIGASKRAGSIGAVVARNLFHSGFQGPVMPVNPNHKAIEGVLTYPDVASLPMTPDLAVIATPPPTIPGLIADLAQRGTKAAVIITAGFGEGGDAAGHALRQEMLAAARPTTLRIVGPNCIGVLAPRSGLNASFAHIQPLPGHLAFVAQSGAIVTSVLDWATARSIGFSHFASLGDMADVDFGDLLDYLANQIEVRGILLYIEAVTEARKFMSAARAASRLKPVIVIKSGRSPAAARAVASHTGALAGRDAVYDAAFRRAGMLRVHDIGGLFGAVETMGLDLKVTGERLAILTNGGGVGVMATDALMDYGGQLAELSEETMSALNAVLPRTWSHGNPVDIIGDAPGARYGAALEILLKDRNADAVLVLNCPTAIASGTEAASAVIATVGGKRHSVLTSWLGESAAAESRRMFSQNRIPTYFTPERAVRAFIDIVNYRRNQTALTETPPSIPEAFVPDVAAARRIIAGALKAGREWLSEVEAKAVLEAYAVPVVPTRAVADPSAAAEMATTLGFPAALKILSDEITHKSDVGGVALDLPTADAVQAAAEAMLKRIAERVGPVAVDGFTVQPMVQRPGAFELIVGASEDPQFGPVILFGHGGTAAEVLNDTALALPPLNMHLAREAIARTRVFKLLQGFRGRPEASLDDIALTLIKIAQLVIDCAEVVELDINPLLADENGVIALDARIRVRASEVDGTRRLAIRPYPKELEEVLELPDGRSFLLRPVRPEDEPAFHELFSRLSPGGHPHALLRAQEGAEPSARGAPDPDRLRPRDGAGPGRARRARQERGLRRGPSRRRSRRRARRVRDHAAQRHRRPRPRPVADATHHRLRAPPRACARSSATSCRENRPMLKVCELFKFTRAMNPDEPGVVQVRLKL